MFIFIIDVKFPVEKLIHEDPKEFYSEIFCISLLLIVIAGIVGIVLLAIRNMNNLILSTLSESLFDTNHFDLIQCWLN